MTLIVGNYVVLKPCEFRRFIGALALNTLVCGISIVSAQTVVRGTIVDAVTRLPIPVVNVIIKNTAYGAATDSTGYFELPNLPPDLYVLEFRHVAYKKRIHVLSLKPSQQVTFMVELQQEVIELKEVEVLASPERVPKLQQSHASTIVTAQQIEGIGATKLTEVLTSFEPGLGVHPLARRRGVTVPWVPYLIYLDGTYVQYIAGSLDNIVDVRQIERIEISRWVGASPNVGPGTSDRVIYIHTKKPKSTK